ncbi:hypothetical protein LCGC14_3106740, partial [marine sediment metagenome]
MRQFIYSLLVLTGLLVFYPATSASAENALTIVVNKGIAPLKFEDESGDAAGLLPD